MIQFIQIATTLNKIQKKTVEKFKIYFIFLGTNLLFTFFIVYMIDMS